MPRKKKEVLKTCGKIETQFPAHVTQTEIAISKLKDAELIDPKTVSYYATKLRECRERIGLTETSVGNLLNLSHVSIVGYENALRPRASIDRTYGAQMVPSLVLMLHEYSSASEKKVRLLSKTTHFN